MVQIIAQVRDRLASGEVRAARVAAGLSQSEFAVPLGVSRATLSSWEVGRRRPRAAAALRLHALLAAVDRSRP